MLCAEKAAKTKADKLIAKGRPANLEELIRMEADRSKTNIRKLTFPHWKRWLGIEHRCIVPVTSFAEPDPKPKRRAARSRMPGLGVTNRSR